MIERASQLQIERAKAKYGAAGVGEIAAVMAHDGADGLKSVFREAYDWTVEALRIVREAPGSERWPTNEDLASELMRQIEVRKIEQGGGR